MRAIVQCPHCASPLIVETKTTEVMEVEPLDAASRCGRLPPLFPKHGLEYLRGAPRVPCRLGKGHGGVHRSETDTVVWPEYT